MHIRGREIISFTEAKRQATASYKQKGDQDNTLNWAGVPLPQQAATSGFLILGTIGSGKTILMRLLMQSILPSIGRGYGRRAVIYDSKRDIVSYIKGMSRCRMHILNPFDERGVAWDIAADCTDLASARELATLFIDAPKNLSQPFFVMASQELFKGVVEAFIINSGTDWTLSDVMNALKTKKSMERVFSSCKHTEYLIDRYFGSDSTFANILSEVSNWIAPFEITAALWSRAKKKISLKQWVNEESILVLPSARVLRSTISVLNQAIFNRLSQIVLDREETYTDQTWFLLDDIRGAGRLSNITELFIEGRSKGACIVLSLQDLEGMKEVYGVNSTLEIISQCSNIAVLRLTSPDAANWASSLFSTSERISLTTSSTDSGHHGTSKSIYSNIVSKTAVLPAEFLSIDPTSLENGLTGWFTSPYVGTYKGTLSGKYLSSYLRAKDDSYLSFAPRSSKDQFLRDWQQEDYQRLKIQENAPAERKPIIIEVLKDDDESAEEGAAAATQA